MWVVDEWFRNTRSGRRCRSQTSRKSSTASLSRLRQGSSATKATSSSNSKTQPPCSNQRNTQDSLKLILLALLILEPTWMEWEYCVQKEVLNGMEQLNIIKTLQSMIWSALCLVYLRAVKNVATNSPYTWISSN